MNGIYRGHTPTMQLISSLSRIKITTPQEAVAFLRALAPLNEQVAYVLQQASLKAQQQVNRQVAVPAPAPEPIPEPEPEKFEAENFSSGEEYSKEEVKTKVAKLKKARNEQATKKKGN